MSGNADNPFIADLQLRISLTPDQIIDGPEAEVTMTRGIAASLDRILGDLLKPNAGILAAADESFNGQIDSIQKTIDRQKNIFDRAQASLRVMQTLKEGFEQIQNVARAAEYNGQIPALDVTGS